MGWWGELHNNDPAPRSQLVFLSNTVNKTRRCPQRGDDRLYRPIALPTAKTRRPTAIASAFHRSNTAKAFAAAAEHRSGSQTPWRNQAAKLAARAICARAVAGNSDRPRFAAWQEDRYGPPAAARPLPPWLARQLRHNAGRCYEPLCGNLRLRQPSTLASIRTPDAMPCHAPSVHRQ
jgi:hypothetical protein